MTKVALLCASISFALAGCASETSKLPAGEDIGAHPTLPPPNHTLLPTLKIAPAKGWGDGAKPVAAPGLDVHAFAVDLDHPRWLYVLPNGDVLVAETNAPPKPEDGKGIRGFFMKRAMEKAGAGTPSANRIATVRASMSRSAPTATSQRMAWTSRTSARRFSKSIRKRATRKFTHSGCAIRTASIGSRRPVRFGSR